MKRRMTETWRGHVSTKTALLILLVISSCELAPAQNLGRTAMDTLYARQYANQDSVWLTSKANLVYVRLIAAYDSGTAPFCIFNGNDTTCMHAIAKIYPGERIGTPPFLLGAGFIRTQTVGTNAVVKRRLIFY
jgi:hypothetical protein